MVIHDEAVRDPERPAVDVRDDRTGRQLAPEAEVDLLDDVGRLLVGGTQPAGEPPELATASFVVLGDAQGELIRGKR